MKIKAVILVFLFLFSAAGGSMRAQAQEYGEESTALGQFVDDFEIFDNVSVRVLTERNVTLNAMELNYTVGSFHVNFSKSILITVESSRITEELIDFPILILLNGSAGINNFNSSIIFDEIGDSYQKIAITNTSFLDERYIEIEYWSASERIAWIWTHGTFSNTSDTELILNYDGTADNNTLFVGIPGSAVASNVWNPDYEAVLHLSEDAGNFQDSTSNNNDGIQFGTVTRAAEFIDGSIDLPGTNDYVRLPQGILDGLDFATVETWVYVDVMGTDRSVVSDWGAGEDVLIFYAQQASAKYRFIWRNLGAVNPNLVFGTVNLDTWEYLATKYVRDDFAYGYENGVEFIGGASGNTPITSPNNFLYIGIDRDLGRDMDGKFDEIRLSSVARSQPWINASYYSGIDDLITQAMGISGGEFASEGYFTTTDYLSDPLTNGSILVQMTNATIPTDTAITVQFSEDNSTWVNSEGAAGFNILTDGFFSIDLRELNWSVVYHLRYNLSTTDPAETPRLYQSRLITTIGNASSIIEIQNISGAWIEYNLTEFNASVGTVDAGLLNSTFFIDGIMFNVSEVVGVPGMILSGNFTNVDDDAISLWVLIYAHYDGNLNHDFDIEVWDFANSVWVEDDHITDGVELAFFNSTIYRLRIPADFLSNGEVRIRLDHESAGNINHDLFIDQIQLQAFIPTETADGETFQLFWIAIAISLMIIGIVLSSMWPHEGDP